MNVVFLPSLCLLFEEFEFLYGSNSPGHRPLTKQQSMGDGRHVLLHSAPTDLVWGPARSEWGSRSVLID